VEGVLLSGGADVDPGHYGEQRHETVTRVVPERDAFELALCRESAARDRPLLAICRGQQVLNVARGGTLIQDIPSEVLGAGDHDPERERWQAAHEVRILPGTRLREILGTERVAVNSFHHQAVRDLGQGLVTSALAVDDGVVEAIEATGTRFLLGVQWHPEAFWNREPSFQPLFEALVAEAARA
jgi:putative glutamine amidotransferase